jgi:3-methyladenine DNA glycosylase/8-oxoguanine DNA glycosylase
MKLTIKTPPDFNFRRTVLSHGWCELPPFELDRSKWILTRVLDSVGRKPITVRLSSGKGLVRIETSRTIGAGAADRIIRDVRHMFRLDDDLRAFYQAMAVDPDFAWIASEGAGRLLRSPTVFEDLVKMLCTTNCSWALTEKMVNELVNELGRNSDDGRKSFPPAEVMAAQPVEFYRDKIRAGYRSAYLKELAERVASGEIQVESWLGQKDRSSSPIMSQSASLDYRTTEHLVKEIKNVKGVGNYAAENLLKLIGRYDGLALDSWTRAQFAKARNKGRVASDKKIMRFYARFDSWRGLALWCDMTRHWLDPENVSKS